MIWEIIISIVGITAYFFISKIGGIFILIGCLMSVVNKLLIFRYINKNVPDLIDIDLALPHPLKGKPYLWESTAGTGVVPKWVSLIGLVGPILVIVGFVFSLVALFT